MTDRKMTATRVLELNGALNRIRALDETAASIARDIEDTSSHWGEKVRSVFGQNRMSQWTNEFLGQVVATAIINELMVERAEKAADIEDEVDCPPPPICFQNPDRDNR